MGSMEFDWGRLIAGQLEFYWDVHLRPRLDGLTDEEYLWEPVKTAWNLRRQPDGSYDLDGGPPPDEDSPPVTTIAWRMMHIAAGCFWTRYQAFFGDKDAAADLDMFDPRFLPADLPGTAAAARPSWRTPTAAGTQHRRAGRGGCASRSASAAAPTPRTPWPP
jgi:hypothetical protein